MRERGLVLVTMSLCRGERLIEAHKSIVEVIQITSIRHAVPATPLA